MLEKIVIVLTIYMILFIHDIPQWRKSTRREKWMYSGFLLPALYLSLVYITGSNWPNLDDLAHYLFREPAKSIVGG